MTNSEWTSNGKRLLLKLSGEAFCKPGVGGIDPGELELIAGEIAAARSQGAEIAVVVGGGNFVRGAQLAEPIGAARVGEEELVGVARDLEELAQA